MKICHKPKKQEIYLYTHPRKKATNMNMNTKWCTETVAAEKSSRSKQQEGM